MWSGYIDLTVTHRLESQLAHDLARFFLSARLLRLGDHVDAGDGVGDAAGAARACGRNPQSESVCYGTGDWSSETREVVGIYTWGVYLKIHLMEYCKLDRNFKLYQFVW